MARSRSRDLDLPRLCQSIYSSRLTLETPRLRRTEHVRLYAGAEWGNNAAHHQQPINLLALYVQIVLRNLIAKCPKVMLSTFDKQSKPMVAAMQQWINREIKAMSLDRTLSKVALDALFCIGITKVALATPSESAVAGWNLSAGQPFAKRVDFDDFVFDIHARDLAEAGFVGHRFRVPLATLQDSKLYSKARKSLTAATDNPYNREGDERINMLFRGYISGTDNDFEDMVDLWEIYLPRHRQIVTVPDAWITEGGASGSDEPLRVVQWLGPDCGPYHLLRLGPDVPNNPIPTAPIPNLAEIHRSVNNAIRKLMEQARRQKDNTFVQGAADADGKRIIDASDGDILRVDNPDKIKAVSQGGPNPGLFAFMTAMKEMFSWLAGNLDMMGGLSPQSKTAAQDKMLAQNAAMSVADMQASVVEHTTDVVEALAWYWHHHPQKVMESTYEVPGVSDVSITRKVTPQDRRQVPFESLDLEINPYSMQHATPQQRSAGLKGIVTQIVAPLMPLLQQQGVMLDMSALLAKIADYDDQPDLGEILSIQPPPQQDSATGGDSPSMKPAETTRNYNRDNRSEKTNSGQSKDLVNRLMGATGAQPGEVNGFAKAMG